MHEISILKDQQMHFGFMDVILLHSGHQHVSTTHVAIFRVERTRIRIIAEIFGTPGRAIAGLSYGRFQAIRHKFHCKLPSKEPLVTGRDGYREF